VHYHNCLFCTRRAACALLQGGVAASAALAVLLAVIMLQAAGPASRAAYDVLAAPAWAPLADLSYSAYLYHLQVKTRAVPCAPIPAAFLWSASVGWQPPNTSGAEVWPMGIVLVSAVRT
jgi:peptidoglycan/LPS O-acetylase OafA/YrhL